MESKQTPNVMTIEEFDNNLGKMTPGDALSIIKETMDNSVSGGLIKSMSQAAMNYRALSVLSGFILRHSDIQSDNARVADTVPVQSKG